MSAGHPAGEGAGGPAEQALGGAGDLKPEQALGGAGGLTPEQALGEAAGLTPEEALATARVRATAARAAGGYADLGGFRIAPKDRVQTDQLMEWAVLEPDQSTMRSTRRLGAPITYFKRALLHVLRQYHGELTAEQTRFNMHLLVYVAELEDRLARLEAERER